jgi:hypothetical protein
MSYVKKYSGSLVDGEIIENKTNESFALLETVRKKNSEQNKNGAEPSCHKIMKINYYE